MDMSSPAVRKLQQARFYLGLIRTENEKSLRKDLSAIEAHVSSCFGHIKSAFYRLEEELGSADFKTKHAAWRASLSQDEREFFNYMLQLRDLDVHTDDIPLSIATSAVSAHLGQDVHSPLGLTVAHAFKYELDDEDIASVCDKFLTMMGRLVEYSHRKADEP